MSDAWEEIQAIKSKRNSLRERLEKRKKERLDILESSLAATTSSPLTEPSGVHSSTTAALKDDPELKHEPQETEDSVKIDPELERELLKTLNEVTLQIPIASPDLVSLLKTALDRAVSHPAVCNLLRKFDTQKLITVKDGKEAIEVVFVEHNKINAVVAEAAGERVAKSGVEKDEGGKRKHDESLDNGDDGEEKRRKEKKDSKTTDIFVSTYVGKIHI